MCFTLSLVSAPDLVGLFMLPEEYEGITNSQWSLLSCALPWDCAFLPIPARKNEQPFQWQEFVVGSDTAPCWVCKALGPREGSWAGAAGMGLGSLILWPDGLSIPGIEQCVAPVGAFPWDCCQGCQSLPPVPVCSAQPWGNKNILQWALCPFLSLKAHFSNWFQLLNGSYVNPQALFPFNSGGTQLPAGVKPRLCVLSFLVAGLDRAVHGEAGI